MLPKARSFPIRSPLFGVTTFFGQKFHTSYTPNIIKSFKAKPLKIIHRNHIPYDGKKHKVKKSLVVAIVVANINSPS